MSFLDEHGKKIDLSSYETWEQTFAKRYVKASDSVLELGARYGVISACIQENKPIFHLAVEPDNSVWEVLEKNLAVHAPATVIFKGFISDIPLALELNGLSSCFKLVADEKSDVVNCKSLKEVMRDTSAPQLTALIADCEGGLEMFIKQNIELCKTLRLVIFEQDNGNACDYAWIKEHLKESGLTCVQLGFHNVWLRVKAKLITFCNDPLYKGLQWLTKSLDKYGWDYKHLHGVWKGFGSKHLELAKYIQKELPSDYTHVFVVDAFDVCVLGTMEEAIKTLGSNDFIFNAEKNCYPNGSLASRYPSVNSEYKYLNGGMVYAKKELYLDSVKKLQNEDNDQLFFSHLYVDKTKFSGLEWFGESYTSEIALDSGCKVFQCYSFFRESEFEYKDGRLLNVVHGTRPVLIHGNGKTNMDKIYSLL
jgi:hypothetical protein